MDRKLRWVINEAALLRDDVKVEWLLYESIWVIDWLLTGAKLVWVWPLLFLRGGECSHWLVVTLVEKSGRVIT